MRGQFLIFGMIFLMILITGLLSGCLSSNSEEIRYLHADWFSGENSESLTLDIDATYGWKIGHFYNEFFNWKYDKSNSILKLYEENNWNITLKAIFDVRVKPKQMTTYCINCSDDNYTPFDAEFFDNVNWTAESEHVTPSSSPYKENFTPTLSGFFLNFIINFPMNLTIFCIIIVLFFKFSILKFTIQKIKENFIIKLLLVVLIFSIIISIVQEIFVNKSLNYITKVIVGYRDYITIDIYINLIISLILIFLSVAFLTFFLFKMKKNSTIISLVSGLIFVILNTILWVLVANLGFSYYWCLTGCILPFFIFSIIIILLIVKIMKTKQKEGVGIE